ncbi:MAG: hypothetical protein GC168_17095 [Candidatus Hydrogenedens sp.]|nr:hypothetical protein [Candidatus Hydrogenedens sp.]
MGSSPSASMVPSPPPSPSTTPSPSIPPSPSIAPSPSTAPSPSARTVNTCAVAEESWLVGPTMMIPVLTPGASSARLIVTLIVTGVPAPNSAKLWPVVGSMFDTQGTNCGTTSNWAVVKNVPVFVTSNVRTVSTAPKSSVVALRLIASPEPCGQPVVIAAAGSNSPKTNNRIQRRFIGGHLLIRRSSSPRNDRFC